MTDTLPPSSFKKWLRQIKNHFAVQPQSVKDLTSLLKNAEARKIIDFDTYKMIDGVLEISQLQVREIMVPRSQMIVLPIEEPLKNIVTIISEASHSRFPVIGENKDDVLGILLVKDFLKAYVYEKNQELDLKTILRPAFFVPESKRLDTLLNEFKARHNHLAIVVDEYGGIAGLVSIEDILEEIVGDIEDEFDNTEQTIQKFSDQHYHVHAVQRRRS
ncbi:MAG: CBS domain-containing protein [Gammaproteobacteria bacterium]|nr:CBS domain-containing protein [Gammaproteobacteria bacterium]